MDKPMNKTKRRVQNLVFDMDGTLFSSKEMIFFVYRDGILKFKAKNPEKSIEIPSLEKLLSLMGIPIWEIYTTLFPDFDSKERSEVMEIIGKDLIQAIHQKKGLLFSGVFETVQKFFSLGYHLFIASNGTRPYIQAILETYDLLQFFEPFVSLDGEKILSKSDTLFEYQKLYGIQSEDTIMVGDRDSDFIASQDFQCSFIGCHYGHGHYEKELVSVPILIEEFSEVIEACTQIETEFSTGFKKK